MSNRAEMLSVTRICRRGVAGAQRDYVASNDQRISEAGVRTLTAEENQFYGDRSAR